MEAFIGTIIPWPMNWAPVGWALCDGQLLNVSQYQALFSLLGVQFGGNGSTTFGLPDLRGRVIVGMGTGPGLTPRNFAAKGGVETNNVVLSVNNLPSHTHPSAGSPACNGDGVLNLVPGPTVVPAKVKNGPASLPSYSTSNNTTLMPPGPTGATGAGQPVAMDNMQPFQVINYIIATEGIYPQRP